MRTVYKYEIPIGDEVEIALPGGAEILTVATQAGAPTLWALVQPDAEPGQQRFRMVGTGHSFEDYDWRYRGTCHDVFGLGLVFHIFEHHPGWGDPF